MATYQDSNVAPPSYKSTNIAATSSQMPISTSPISSAFRSQPILGFYKTSMSDMKIATSASDIHPLFYIATHGGFSSSPSVCIHQGASPSQPLLASADFKSFSSKVDVSLGASGRYVLEKEGVFSAATVFYMPVQSSGNSRERFEWKSSSGAEVAGLNGRSSGLKCVRCSTGQVVAAFAHVSMSSKKIGKMRFLGEKMGLGEAVEMMVFVSLCAVIEKGRRSSRSGAAAGGGGATGGGGGGGGGGC